MAEPIDELRRSMTRVAGALYMPNKLHGDEILHDGRVYQQDQDEWLRWREVEALVVATPATPSVFLDRNEPVAGLYQFRSMNRDVLASMIKPLYLSDDGFPPEETGYFLVAYLWASPDEGRLLLFELEC